MLRPIERSRVAEGIVDQLRSLILTGAVAPGERLPPERVLAGELGVNRASLREALKRLEHLGLVRIRQGDGTRVLDFMSSGGLELLGHLIPLAQAGDAAILRDLLEFRRTYGREVARLAATRADETHLCRLRALADAADAPGLAAEEVLRLDFEFYVELTRASRNSVFQLLINTTRAAIHAHATFFAPFTGSTAGVRRHHRALLEALAARDPARAGRVADEYLSGGMAELLGGADAAVP